jgi:hypothetical protein
MEIQEVADCKTADLKVLSHLLIIKLSHWYFRLLLLPNFVHFISSNYFFCNGV